MSYNQKADQSYQNNIISLKLKLYYGCMYMYNIGLRMHQDQLSFHILIFNQLIGSYVLTRRIFTWNLKFVGFSSV